MHLIQVAVLILMQQRSCSLIQEKYHVRMILSITEILRIRQEAFSIRGDGDDEQIRIDLSKVPANITKIAFTVTIYDAEARHQNFGQVNNAFVRIYNEANGEELLRYDLGEDFSIETAAVFGELYKHGDEWKFNAIGSGYQGGLAALCNNYGIEVE